MLINSQKPLDAFSHLRNTPDFYYSGMLELSADDVGKVAGGATVHYVMPDLVVKGTRPKKQQVLGGIDFSL
jgi:hypothetical protein